MHVYACLFLCFMLALASLVLGFATLDTLTRFVVVWLRPMPMRPCLDVTIWEMPVASCIPFPFSASCDDMLTMLVCVTRWLSMHLYILAYMSMHESCLLVCRPCFNTMKLWTSDPNLNLSLVDTTFFFAFSLVCLLACLLALLFLCLPCLPCLSTLCIFICSLHLFLLLLVCWFLVFAFACTHMEQGHIELGHDHPSTSKKGADANMSV